MAHSSATITGLADSEICLRICVIYDSHEGVDVTIPTPKDYRCVKIHWYHFSKQEVQIRCFRWKQVDEGSGAQRNWQLLDNKITTWTQTQLSYSSFSA